MSFGFYSSPEYRKLQSDITKTNWVKGIYNYRIKPLETRTCKNLNCGNTFKVKHFDPKIFCSHRCAAHVGNIGRKLSLSTRLKISKSVSLLPQSIFKRRCLPRITLVCLRCGKKFEVVPYLAKRRKYCSSLCAIKTIGSRTTSPKASKGKPGIRADIDPNICFYSTWEANIARVFNLVGLKWVYAPKIFDLGKHTYRPDFYLPYFDMFIEVKNFLGVYSLKRHLLFKKRYPNIKLKLLMKKGYLEIKENYKELIDNWED